jgi:carboxypeptidase Taq
MGVIDDLAGAARMLEWDRETLMPEGASTGRGHQVATLHALRHREVVAPGIDGIIDEAAATPDLTPAEHAMIRHARRERQRGLRVPESLVRELSAATNASVVSWLEHRHTGDFAAFAPALRRVVEAVREWGTALAVGDEPYDGLLDEHEPGMRTADLEPIFERLTREITALIATVPERPEPSTFTGRTWAGDAQFALAHDIARMVGFRFDTGLIALSAHPFTTSPHIGDARFTTRITANDPTQNVLVTLHELGHAMYSQGHPAEYARTLVFTSPSLGAEESQARFLENHVGRNSALWTALAPMMASRFGAAMDGITATDMHRAATRVSKGWIRVDADELTYDLHIALRFQLELGLVRGTLDVADLPEAWNDGLQRLLGIGAPTNRDGCMQDIHWAWGSFGYFPTYTLGNIYAAQISESLEAELGSIGEIVERGEFLAITEYLRERIHRHGSIMSTSELMKHATGHEFSLEPFLRRATRLAADAR